jgi:octaprenyl-diphosphate synthase
MGAALEMVHTATLLHDDVVDDSPIRRGQKTAKEIWGNAASVLVGDYLYAQAYRLFTESHSLSVLKAVAQATHALAEGEVLQLTQRRNCHITLEEHLKILHCKTATLFELAGVLGATPDPMNEPHALAYGSHLGMAFQLIDDALDYAGDSASLGKRVGDDLSDGNFTYPLLHALHQACPADKTIIQTAILQGNTEALGELQAIIRATGSIEATQALAQRYAAQALDALKMQPNTPYLQALKDLATFAIMRHY